MPECRDRYTHGELVNIYKKNELELILCLSTLKMRTIFVCVS